MLLCQARHMTLEIRVYVQANKQTKPNNCMSQSQGPCTLNRVFENQPILSGILTQLSSRKQFASRRKRSLEKGGRSLSVYTSILQILFPDKPDSKQAFNATGPLTRSNFVGGLNHLPETYPCCGCNIRWKDELIYLNLIFN